VNIMKKMIFKFILVVSLLLTGCSNKNSADIGIIGGADGPTAVFVTSSINWFDITLIGIVVVVAVILIIYFIKRRKK